MKFFSCLFIFAVIMAVFVQLAPAKPALERFQRAVGGKRECAKVGEKCYSDSGCCSRICMPYKKQCVANTSLQYADSDVDNTIG